MLRYYQWLDLRTALFSCYDGPVVGSGRHTITVDYYSAWLVRSGSIFIKIDRKTLKASTGEWLVAPPGKREIRYTSETRLLSVTFFADWTTGSRLIPTGLPLLIRNEPNSKLELAASRINEWIEQSHPHHDFFIHNRLFELEDYLKVQRLLPDFLTELLSELRRHGVDASSKVSLDPRIERALQILNRHPINQPLPNAEIASRIGLSPTHFQRLFVEELGRTPKQYFDRRRLAHVENELFQSTSQIKTIAIGAGFLSMGNFTRWFQRFHMVSPSQFRARVRSSIKRQEREGESES